MQLTPLYFPSKYTCGMHFDRSTPTSWNVEYFNMYLLPPSARPGSRGQPYTLSTSHLSPSLPLPLSLPFLRQTRAHKKYIRMRAPLPHGHPYGHRRQRRASQTYL